MLYVDRRYVIGAQCIEGIPKSIVLPNHEERIWLYFFEDIDHDKIVYGKNNESHYLNNEPHYFGDVFPKILDSRNEFTRFRRKKALREIFHDSGIFDDLRKSFSSEQDIDTFVSFSTDIPLAARSVFLEELSEAGFSIKISVARIEHLALENAMNKNEIVDDGQYLVLNAYNETLHYSLYDHSGGLFVRMDEDKMEGLGADLRGRALIEEVVKKANIGNHYLTKERFELECQRMTQLFLGKWLIKLDNAKQNIPFAIDNVWFAVAPNNKQTIQIKKKDIDDHTKGIVDEIVKVLGRFVAKSGDKEKLKGLILLGDTFSNSMFEKALNEQFNFASKPIVRHRISGIKEIISTYLNIDCEQFSADTKKFSNNAAAERKRIENAIREEEERIKADKEQEERELKERAAYDAEKMYNVEMQGVNEYEMAKDYVRMLESCEAALKHKPNDSEALKKKKEAERFIAQEDVKSEQYNTAIKKAKECFDAGQYKEALFYSESALTLRPDSSEAKRIRDNSQNVLNAQARIEKFSTRADLFIGQKLYEQAISELQKILTIDSDNKVAKKKLNEIKNIQQKAQKEIDDLLKQLREAESNGEYEDAVSICKKLRLADSSNISTWEDKIKRLKEDFEKKTREKELLSELREKTNSAVFEERWGNVVELCKESLKICPDESAKKLLKRAQIKLKEETEEKQFQDGLSSVKKCIVEKKWQEAENALNALQKQYPERVEVCKQLRTVIFNEQDKDEIKPISKPNTKKGISKPTKKADDFFEKEWSDDSPNMRRKKSSEISAKNPSVENRLQPPTGDDFFDNDVSDNARREKTKINKKNISITDFNF